YSENFTSLAKTRSPFTRFRNSTFPLPLCPSRPTSLLCARLSPRPTTCSNYFNPNWQKSPAGNFADYRNGSSTSAMNSITSPQNERTLASQAKLADDQFGWLFRVGD